MWTSDLAKKSMHKVGTKEERVAGEEWREESRDERQSLLVFVEHDGYPALTFQVILCRIAFLYKFKYF